MDLFSVLLIVVLTLILYKLLDNKKYPPGPIPLPFYGNTSLVKKLCREHNGLQNAFRELCRMYNTDILSLKLGGCAVIVVQSEELINHVLFTDEFQGRPDNFFIRLRCLGKRSGITMTDGPHWAEQRAFAVKNLHELGLGRKRMNDLIQTQLQELFSILEHSEINSTSLRKLFSKCVLNVLWEIVTGENFKKKEEHINDLISYMEERAKAFDPSGGVISQLPFLRHICPDYIGYTLIQKLNNRFKSMIMPVIEEHKKTYDRNVTRDYIDAFLHEMYSTNTKSSSFTDDQLLMVCLDFFIAGSQTTSSTLDLLLLQMIINPTIQEKVQNELGNLLKPGDIPSINDKKNCPYTEAVICESQRLTPVGPVIGPRRVLRDTTINGYFIPKNTTVFLNIEASNRNPENWEDPNKMNPDRFLSEEGKEMKEKRLFSFAKGKRRCPGEALAKNFTFIFFSGIVHNYKLQAQDKNNPPKLKTITGITQSPAEYILKLTKRY